MNFPYQIWSWFVFVYHISLNSVFKTGVWVLNDLLNFYVCAMNYFAETKCWHYKLFLYLQINIIFRSKIQKLLRHNEPSVVDSKVHWRSQALFCGIQRVLKKTSFKDFYERLDDIFQNWFWILKLVVYPRHLKN